ncbi:MAG: nitroreductase family protein [Chloroflexota bacterium]
MPPASPDSPLSAITARRSVRRFRPDPLPDDVLKRILAAATSAPSAHNRQPWRFAVLTTPAVKVSLAEALAETYRADLIADGRAAEEIHTRLERSLRRITAAPVAIVLCTDFAAGDFYPDAERTAADNLMLVQDATLAGGTLLLAAHAEGIGACWMCAPLFAPATTREHLTLPESWEPLALILLGYPAEGQAVPKRPRLSLDEVARYF